MGKSHNFKTAVFTVQDLGRETGLLPELLEFNTQGWPWQCLFPLAPEAA